MIRQKTKTLKDEGHVKLKTTVKSYQQNIEAEKQKMGAYSNKFKTSVRSLQANFKKHAKDMREDGIRNMSEKVRKFNNEIKGQIQENKEAVSHIANNVKFFQSEISKKKKDFQAYVHGPFNSYIKSFWG